MAEPTVCRQQGNSGAEFSKAPGSKMVALAMAAAVVLAGAGPASADDPLRGPVIEKQAPPESKHVPDAIPPEKIKTDIFVAYGLAKAPWLDKAAAADPSIVEAICQFPGPAKLLARHRHLAEIAEADHYLCRRLTRWKGATGVLIRNRHADQVIRLDPEGIYRAIDRDPGVASALTKHIMFNQMIVDTPDLGRVIAEHI